MHKGTIHQQPLKSFDNIAVIIMQLQEVNFQIRKIFVISYLEQLIFWVFVVCVCVCVTAFKRRGLFINLFFNQIWTSMTEG